MGIPSEEPARPKPKAAPRPPRRMVRRVRFQAGSSTPLHLVGVELEKVSDDFGFVRVVRKTVGGNGQDTQYAGGSVIRPYHFADTARSEAAPYHFAAKMEYPPSAASPRSGCPSRGAFPVNAAPSLAPCAKLFQIATCAAHGDLVQYALVFLFGRIIGKRGH